MEGCRKVLKERLRYTAVFVGIGMIVALLIPFIWGLRLSMIFLLHMCRGMH